MPVSFYKVFSLCTRVFTKPLLNYVKSVHLWNFNQPTGFNKLFVMMGHGSNRLELWLNYKLMNLKTDTEMFARPLTPEMALEKGVSVFYDLLFYCTVLIVGGYELVKSYRINEEKKQKEQEFMTIISNRVQSTHEKVKRLGMKQEISYSQVNSQLETVKAKLRLVLADTATLVDSEHETLQVMSDIEHRQAAVRSQIRKYLGSL